MRNRKIQIPLRLNEKEFKYIQKQVDKSCLNREKYLRSLILGHKIYSQPCEEYFQIVKLLSSTVNNNDKIARIVGMTGEVSEKDICYMKLMAQKLWTKFNEMD